MKFERAELPVGTPVVGMVGGGQLARMTQQAAVALGVQLRVLAEGRARLAARGWRHLRIKHLVHHQNEVAIMAMR